MNETMTECERLGEIALAAAEARDPVAAERALAALLVAMPDLPELDANREQIARDLTGFRERRPC